jgi:hypothetical protein
MSPRDHDPCPCKSGRKFKKCCGAARVPGRRLAALPGPPEEVDANVVAYATPLLEGDEHQDPEGILGVAAYFYALAAGRTEEEFLRETEDVFPPGVDPAAKEQLRAFHRSAYQLHLRMFPDLHWEQPTIRG